FVHCLRQPLPFLGIQRNSLRPDLLRALLRVDRPDAEEILTTESPRAQRKQKIQLEHPALQAVLHEANGESNQQVLLFFPFILLSVPSVTLWLAPRAAGAHPGREI